MNIQIYLLAILLLGIKLPCTQVAPTASSTFNQISKGALIFASHAPTIPMKTDSRVVTRAHPAVMPI